MKISLLFIIISSCLPILTYPQQGDNYILATVGDHLISKSEFINRYSDYLFASGVKDNLIVREAIVNNMINEIILYNYDSNDKIYSDKEYQREIEWLWKQSVLAYLKDQEVYAKITVTEEELREVFIKINEQIAARHLFAATEDEANELYELLNKGYDFHILAQSVFTDSILKNNGGYLGYFSWGDMDPAFEEAAYSLQIGEISKPVKTKYGYSIIKVEDRFIHPVLTEYDFQRKKTNLDGVIRMNKKRPYEKEFMSKVFDSEKVSFNEESISKILGRLQLRQTGNELDLADYSDIISVTYNDKQFTEQMIEQKINHIPLYHREKINSTEKLKIVIEGLILQDILYSIAVNKGFTEVPEVIETFAKLKNNTFLKYKMEEILENYILADSLVLNYYSENIKYFSTPREINLQEIIVADKELADSLFEALDNGEDFGMLAGKYSIRKWSAENEGVVGFSQVSKFGMFEETFWQAELGVILRPLRFDNYFGIFRVLGKKDSEPINLEIVRRDVEQAAKLENKRDIIEKYIEMLKDDVNISIDMDLLSIDDIIK